VLEKCKHTGNAIKGSILSDRSQIYKGAAKAEKGKKGKEK
jgi:hypothetical protein